MVHLWMFYLDTKTVPRRTSRQIEQRIHEKPVRRPRIPSSVQVSGISEQVSDIGTLVWPGHQVLVCPVFLRGYRACSSVWLERALDKREVGGSSPPWPTIYFIWGISSAGRAPDLHSGGRRFDPDILHHRFVLFVL